MFIMFMFMFMFMFVFLFLLSFVFVFVFVLVFRGFKEVARGHQEATVDGNVRIALNSHQVAQRR